MPEQLKPAASLAGRVLLSAIFLLSGFTKITNWSGTAGYMASEGMPAVPFFLVLAILFELGAGLCVLVGFQTRLAALALILFLVPATLVFHDFWTHEGMQRQNQMLHFLKNLTIMGGLLTLAAAGAGAYSVDARLRSEGWPLSRREPLPR